jgi:NAD(P)-dependent dehydrogenase (short-subunit alcohol dehydrogenase family)
MHLLVVGPGRIGEALALRLQQDGHHLTIRSREAYGDFFAPTYDPSAAVAGIERCDAVLLCAGLFELNASLERMVQANHTALVRIAEAIHARFPQAHVISFLDARIRRPPAGVPAALHAYMTSKRIHGQWTLATAKVWGETTGCRVNAIAPGPVLPPPDKHHSEKAGTCLTPRPTVEDLYRAVDFLLKTPSVTGQILYVDAGQHLL